MPETAVISSEITDETTHESTFFETGSWLSGRLFLLDRGFFKFHRFALIDVERLVGWKDEVVEEFTSGVESLCQSNGVSLLSGHVQFTDEATARVNSENSDVEVSFKTAIVATVSRPITVPNFEFDGERVLDSRSALSLSEMPEDLVVLLVTIQSVMHQIYGPLNRSYLLYGFTFRSFFTQRRPASGISPDIFTSDEFSRKLLGQFREEQANWLFRTLDKVNEYLSTALPSLSSLRIYEYLC